MAIQWLRADEWGCVVQIEAHFDESGTEANELTLAGYIFESERIEEFCDEWNKVLSAFGLPYFHMVDCAHRSPPFNELSSNSCVRVQMKLMRLIKKFSINGFVVNSVNSTTDKSGEPYKQAAISAGKLIAEWAKKVSYGGQITYIFEAGAKGQGKLNAWFQDVMRNPDQRTLYQYADHSFVPKQNNPGVQAADLLAWQYQNFTKKRLANSVARRDLRALLRHPHLISDEAGDAASVSRVRSVERSRKHVETVYYLPRASEAERDPAKSSIFDLRSDQGIMFVDPNNYVLACPKCFRAIAVTPNRNAFKNVTFKCFCGEHSRARGYIIPEAVLSV